MGVVKGDDLGHGASCKRADRVEVKTEEARKKESEWEGANNDHDQERSPFDANDTSKQRNK